MERAELAELARIKAEEEARILAEKMAQERKATEDVQKAQAVVNGANHSMILPYIQHDGDFCLDFLEELRWQRDALRKGGIHCLKHGLGEHGRSVWCTEPEILRSGCDAKLRYNSKAGPLNWIDWENSSYPLVTVGHNSWRDATDIQMTRTAEPETEDECWWEAEFRVSRTRSARQTCKPDQQFVL